VLAGCFQHSLIAGEEEVEENAGLSLAWYALPGAALRRSISARDSEEATAGGSIKIKQAGRWHRQ